MTVFLAILTLLLAGGLLFFLGVSICREGLKVSTVFLTIMVLSNVLGLTLMPLILEQDLLNTGNVLLPFSPEAYMRQVASAIIFLAGSFCFLYASSVTTCLPIPSPVRWENSLTRSFVGTAIFLVGFGLWMKYMIYGAGLNLALSTNFYVLDFSKAAANRAEVREGLQTGQGYYSALLGSYAVLPLSVAVLRLRGWQNRYFLTLWTIGLILSMLFAVSLRQKAPLIMMFFVYGGIISTGYQGYGRLWRNMARPSTWWGIVLGIITIFAGLGVFYQMTEGETFILSMQKSIARVFITPCASAHLWYIVFPSQLPFQGLFGIFSIQSPFAADSSVTIIDVALQSTGSPFSANASFLAVAWSGFGYLGVVLATGVLLLCLHLIDNYLAPLRGSYRTLCFALLVPAFTMVSSASLFDVIAVGAIPVALAFALLLRCRII